MATKSPGFCSPCRGDGHRDMHEYKGTKTSARCSRPSHSSLPSSTTTRTIIRMRIRIMTSREGRASPTRRRPTQGYPESHLCWPIHHGLFALRVDWAGMLSLLLLERRSSLPGPDPRGIQGPKTSNRGNAPKHLSKRKHKRDDRIGFKTSKGNKGVVSRASEKTKKA